ncbi:MAG: AfsR/SARP family transcriptional regulator, partial [Solirubrobacteraceae bacterium]
MIRWFGRIRPARRKKFGSPSRSARQRAGTWPNPELDEHRGASTAALEIAADDRERLAHELEQASAAHRVAARNLRARINTLALHPVAETGKPLAGEEEAAFGQYLIVAKLLGPFEMSLGGTAVKWRSQRAASLLKYLLLDGGGPVRREVLMSVFWPFSDTSAARNNLNVAVYSLRRTLRFVDPHHRHIIYQDGAYLLEPSLRRWVDVPEFTAACRLGHRHFEAGDLTRAITACRHARTLYRGPLMEGDVSGDWFRDDELRLQYEHHLVLERLGAALLLHGELNASIEVGRELVSADPCRETGHQLLMRGYAALQQPQLVIRQYRYCADVLHRELSVEPGAATRALLE